MSHDFELTCPRCQVPLKEVRPSGGVFYGCEVCGGDWSGFTGFGLPAWFVFVLWILFQIVGTLEQRAGMSSGSSAAHLGGAAAGVLAWLVWRKPNQESRLLE